jgi:hypothetical protein
VTTHPTMTVEVAVVVVVVVASESASAIIPRQRLITSPDLRCYSVYVELSLHVIVCLSCCKTVHLHHIRSHLVSDHDFKQVPKHEDLCAHLLKIGALPTSDIDFPDYPVPRIVGIDVTDGFQCLEDDCKYIEFDTL